jgi:hypothetical protein
MHGRMFGRLRGPDFFNAACDGELMREIGSSAPESKGTTSLVLATVESASDRDVRCPRNVASRWCYIDGAKAPTRPTARGK